ncbi:hypothetical protein [Thermoanaerobacterium sp. DL9XJH110]|uniref:hypothetical protein n=1 Tax=Thermoanaerobacterium sp. DL9XJH110 TaxID=3386643 RepID=UPI003BB6C31F
MQDQFTYSSLGTLTGAVTATVMVVEFLKESGCFKLIRTRWLVFLVAQSIVMITSIARHEFSIINIPLIFLNGLLVTTSAMGSWHILSDSMFNFPREKDISRETRRPGCG